MKIILLLLSSAVLAILSYGFFRVNVTDFYTYIETLEKPFDEKKFLNIVGSAVKNVMSGLLSVEEALERAQSMIDSEF